MAICDIAQQGRCVLVVQHSGVAAIQPGTTAAWCGNTETDGTGKQGDQHCQARYPADIKAPYPERHRAEMRVHSSVLLPAVKKTHFA